MEGTTYNELTSRETYVIESMGTEPPFSGEYDDCYQASAHVCRRCNAERYRLAGKFDAGCGWPAFDDEVPGTVTRVPDPDGHRTGIECATRGGHPGHVFRGEPLTTKNTRHGVNSLSMKFVPSTSRPRQGCTNRTAWCEMHVTPPPCPWAPVEETPSPATSRQFARRVIRGHGLARAGSWWILRTSSYGGRR